MAEISSVAGGFALMASLIVAVGAQNTFVLRQGLRREHVGAVVLFCSAADAMLMGAGVAGLGAALGNAPALTRLLTLGGAVFLARYGLAALCRALAPGVLAPDRGGHAMTLRATIARAAGFTLLNPHVYLDTVLLLGTVGASRPAGERPLFLIGAALASATWFFALGYGARLLAPFFARPGAWRVLDGVVAVTMAWLAAALLWQACAGVR